MEKLVRFQRPAGIFQFIDKALLQEILTGISRARHDCFARHKQLKLILLLPPASCTDACLVAARPWPTMWTPQGSCAADGFVSLARSSAPRSTLVSSVLRSFKSYLWLEGQEHPNRAKVCVVGDVGLARDDGDSLQPRQRDRQGDANVGPHLMDEIRC